MENSGRNTIAGRAAILKNGATGIPERSSPPNSIAGRATMLINSNLGIPKQLSKANQPPRQNNTQNYGRQMAGGTPITSNNEKPGTRPMELNLKVSPPPSNTPVQRNIEWQSKRPVSSYEGADIISTERLQEAIIWSEILGEPLSKRRRRHRS
ncbi:MAG: hypothetical protein K0S04_1750 [Herbinix sp.]|jgi:hypothetical protein|nr:hypothetical protein [Herbinix sp.]